MDPLEAGGSGPSRSWSPTAIMGGSQSVAHSFSMLKNEMHHHRAFTHRIAARTVVMEYIETWYNRRRPHTNNCGVSPLTKLEHYRAAQNPLLAA